MVRCRRRDAEDADEEEDVFEGGSGFLDDDDEKSAESVLPIDSKNESFKTALGDIQKNGFTISTEKEPKQTDHDRADDDDDAPPNERIAGTEEDETPFVPRNDRYFLHEDRCAEPDEDENGSNPREVTHFRFRADEVTSGAGVDHALEERAELVDVDNTKEQDVPSSSKWLHDRYDLLDSDHPLPDPVVGGLSNRYPHRPKRGGGRGHWRGGYSRGRIRGTSSTGRSTNNGAAVSSTQTSGGHKGFRLHENGFLSRGGFRGAHINSHKSFRDAPPNREHQRLSYTSYHGSQDDYNYHDTSVQENNTQEKSRHAADRYTGRSGKNRDYEKDQRSSYNNKSRSDFYRHSPRGTNKNVDYRQHDYRDDGNSKEDHNYGRSGHKRNEDIDQGLRDGHKFGPRNERRSRGYGFLASFNTNERGGSRTERGRPCTSYNNR